MRNALCADREEEALLPSSIPITRAAETKESPTQNEEEEKEEEEEGRRLAHLSIASNETVPVYLCECERLN